MSSTLNFLPLCFLLTIVSAAPPQEGPVAAGSSSPGLSIPSPPDMDWVTLMFHVDMIIFAIFGIFTLFVIPRCIARFSRKSEWLLGHLLRSVPRRVGINSASINVTLHKSQPEAISDLDTSYSHKGLIHRQLSLPPTHLASWSSFFHNFSEFLGRPVLPGSSLGRVIILLGYFAILVASTVWYDSSPFVDIVRPAWIATTQMPIIFALATKNNLLGMLLGSGYEKLNYIHRFVGRLAAIGATIHFLYYCYIWCAQGLFITKLKEAEFFWGLVGIIGIDLLAFFSTELWRSRHYNVFMYAHILGFIMFPLGVAMHKPDTRPWVYAAIGVYALDRIMRLVKTRISTATLRPIPELGATRVEVPGINAGWRAGQHIRIRVLSSGMGILGWSEVHPFTIASASGDGLVLICKKTGGWTNSLFNLASGGLNSGEKGLNSTNSIVIVEGPYGGVGHTMMDGFSGALFVAGGSGITFALASMEELIQKDIAGKSRVKVLQLVWSVQDPTALQPMLPQFTSFLEQAASTNLDLQISVYYTRATNTSPETLYRYLPPNITVSTGRPRTNIILDSLIDRTCNGSLNKSSPKLERRIGISPSGVFVGVCGPMGLGEQVRKVVGEVSAERRYAVGGVELCEEIFGT